jgi:hypothetical protein
MCAAETRSAAPFSRLSKPSLPTRLKQNIVEISTQGQTRALLMLAVTACAFLLVISKANFLSGRHLVAGIADSMPFNTVGYDQRYFVAAITQREGARQNHVVLRSGASWPERGASPPARSLSFHPVRSITIVPSLVFATDSLPWSSPSGFASKLEIRTPTTGVSPPTVPPKTKSAYTGK